MIGAVYLAMAVCAVHTNDEAVACRIGVTEIEEVTDMRAAAASTFSGVALLA